MSGFILHDGKIRRGLSFLGRYFDNYIPVYDGHGSSGKEASQAANDYIQTYLEKNAKKIKSLTSDKQKETFLKSAFKNAESKLKSSGIDYSNSGTCAISVFVFKNICYIANLGDSRAVLFRYKLYNNLGKLQKKN